MSEKIKIAIVGASGYTGVELIRLLLQHPQVEISALVANSSANCEISSIYQHLALQNLPIMQNIEAVDFSKIQAVFMCLPHTTTQETCLKLLVNKQNQHLKIIDLSADFRLKNTDDYQKWYQHQHLAKHLQEKAVYALTEIYRHQLAKKQIISCPGCYPTSVLLPLYPLLVNNLINPHNIIIDAKSGTSGAGRSLKTNNLFCEVNESVKAYSIGNHRHLGEISQELSLACNQEVNPEFTPHLLPVNRGIISTIYVDILPNFTHQDLKNCLATKYDGEYFVHLVEHLPSLKDVVNTNMCLINISAGNNKNKAIIVSVLDNLVKGASGQAVQNFNNIFGIDERTGLNLLPIFP
ncbi:MAG: N-acetyl-gamma-glutamyl-phosphate reductase [Proteobacteria bacterium]|nr:N-acetyl-gamma-glutamyl-phosphate reductase [Pseudomonadota bacterium]